MFDAFNNNIKNVFIQIRSRGDALYKSKIVNINNNVEENFDPLEYTLSLGNLLNINVHAWINTYLVWSSSSSPVDSTHIYYSNPEWFDSNQFGKLTYENDLTDNDSYDWKGLFLSPNNPQVNLYILNIIKEITLNYPGLSGIHFDYIRFQDRYYGFNKIGLKEFKEEYGFDPKDIINGKINEKYGWSKSEVDSISNLWFNSNCDNITNLLKSIRTHLKTTNSDILISAAVKSNPIESKNRWFQDWKLWIEDDIVDFIIPMNYAVESKIFMNNLKAISSNILNNDKIIMGISIYNQNEKKIAEKILLTNYSGYKKICLFSYETIKNNNINLELVKYEYLKKKYMFED